MTTHAVAQTGTGPATLTLDAVDATSGVALTEYRVNGSSFAASARRLAAAAEWLTYSAASKPAFTANGTYSIEYRSTDVAGNVETPKTVTFTVGAPTGGDVTAPVTNASLDPATPGPGRIYPGPVTVKFSALDLAPPATRTSTPTARSGRRPREPERGRHGHVALRRDRGQRRTTCGCSRRAATRARPGRTSSRCRRSCSPAVRPSRAR